MKTRTKIVLGIGLAAGAAGIGAVTVGAASSDDHEPAITGSALRQASAAALAETGGGRVTGSEVGDEESYYEVEVTLDDGRQVDVQLDRDFRVVDTAADHESEHETDGS